ncbi:NADPH:quinone reductase [Natronincola peptidivorans]|uniref:NADPH:quinone reductase n=1 Tax=Natronincola peptidivorans TaxID=426128 RepID=A0A1I0ECT9_9FIRM|nr:NAD(P)-dependent alcohol dehydrogenase [Natronincola peptidivorans]SET43069.1 NADPH:quinone reductase [Natronincola peptidivorans]
MEAIICTKYGGPEALQCMEVEKPVPKDNEVLIRIYATTVTRGDTRIRGFDVPLSFWIPARLALGLTKPRKDILGNELAGVVESVGKDVTLYKKGDQVVASTGMSLGTYAEYKCLPQDAVIVKKPINITFEEAAAIPIGGRTALHFLRKANIQQGQKVLIYGASGSVGTYAVQIAKHFGAEVTGLCSTTNIELIKSLGADKVIDYINEDFTKSREVYDVIYDTVGKSSVSDCIKSIKKNGVYLQSGTPAVNFKILWNSMTSDKKIVKEHAPEKVEDLLYLKELVETNKIRPIIDQVFTLEEIEKAHRYVDKGRKKGNVVITISQNVK